MKQEHIKIVVASRDNISFIDPGVPYMIISMRDPGTTKIDDSERPDLIGTCHLEFHDLNSPMRGFFHFDNADAHLVWKAVDESLKAAVQIIICQCEAGISRSAGMAAAIAKSFGQDDSYYFKRYIPNMLVYRTMLRVRVIDTDAGGNHVESGEC